MRGPTTIPVTIASPATIFTRQRRWPILFTTELGLRSMAAIHDGDPYSSGLTAAFTAAFEQLGGSVAVAMVNKGDTDMLPVLTEVAAGSPEGLFLPIFPEEAGPILRQSSQVDGLEGLTRIGGGGLLVSEFLGAAGV